ncbi:MAG: hypothetical protein ACFCUS_08055 [Rubrimonas sp.]|uniref:head-tail connector protein n=1 Tax=Rubrimonas sp. TaxID=2036015 RepID=UPI002FDDCDC4
MLTELERPAVAPGHIGALAERLRLPSGFADDAQTEPLLARCLEFATALVERLSGRAMAQRRFRLSVRRWNVAGRCEIPIAPVRQIEGIGLVDAAALRTDLDVESVQIDGLRFPGVLSARGGGGLPPIPKGGLAEIDMTAGFGPDWRDAPVDLREALLMIAATSFEAPEAAQPPLGALRLIEPYRRLRL